MKLDKIKFAKLIAYIATEFEKPIYGYQIEAIDEMVDVEVPEQTNKVPMAMVDELMKAISDDRRIEAIKAYRSLTGAGLKESKDQVEKYWPKPAPLASVSTLRELGKEHTLGDILASKATY